MPSAERASPFVAQIVPPAEGEVRSSPEEQGRRLAILPRLLVGALALLLASFPARNNDLWAHLAGGRGLAHWRPSSGYLPPFGATWLADLLFFGLYSALGGPGLVFLKALLVVGLALLLLQLSRADRGWWIAVVSVVLSLLAMSTRLLLQPVTLSYFLLGLALWLVRPREDVPADRQPFLPPWPLLLLFAAWANLDRSFVIGLVVVGLVWLGRALDLARDDEEAEGQGGSHFFGRLRKRMGSLLVSVSALGAVCLLNPSGVFAFVPSGLGEFAAGNPGEVLGADRVRSPFEGAYLTALGQTPAGLAYFPLLALGLLSFLVNLPRGRWERFLPWLALAALSAAAVRYVPFFAVVAAPVLAGNLHDLFGRHKDAERMPSQLWRGWLVVGNVLTGVLGLAFLVCAWPGWLQGPPFEPRRWAVEPLPSLEHGAAASRRWLQEGRLSPEARGLHLSRESAEAFAWFCPEARGVLDGRLTAAFLGADGPPADWAERMRAAGVNHVIVYDPDRTRLFVVLTRLLGDPHQWPLLYQEGELAVFGWRDPSRYRDGTDPFRGWGLDLEALAFRPDRARRVPSAEAAEVPRPRRWWDAFWKPAPPRQLDRDEATLHLLHAEAMKVAAPQGHLTAWEAGQSAAILGSVGTLGPNSSPAAGLLGLHLRLVLLQPTLPQPGSGVETLAGPDRMAYELQRRFTWARDDTPPSLPYLAVRAARRALVADPEDVQAHLVLGESYLALLRGTRERAWGTQFPEMAQLRIVQASTALNQAVLLNPRLAQAHLSLGGFYRELGYRDLALNHLRAYHKLVREAGPPPGVTALQFRQRQAQFEEQQLDPLAKEVAEQEQAYAKAAPRLAVFDRAVLASRNGLAGKARDMLLGTDVAAFGLPGMQLELELLLKTGRARDVLDWLLPEHKATLGAKPYHWLRIQALAALGAYAGVQEECRSLASADRGDGPGGARALMSGLIGRAILDGPTAVPSVPRLYQRAVVWLELDGALLALVRSLRQEADVTVLRGLLALEEGAVEDAEAAFRSALGVWKDEATAASGAGLDFSSRIVAQGCLEWLEQAR